LIWLRRIIQISYTGAAQRHASLCTRRLALIGNQTTNSIDRAAAKAMMPRGQSIGG
jgi:hypothetical protein